MKDVLNKVLIASTTDETDAMKTAALAAEVPTLSEEAAYMYLTQLKGDGLAASVPDEDEDAAVQKFPLKWFSLFPAAV
jgi:hypothetical protein